MNQELVEYIKQQTSLNVSKNKITDVLLGQGWQQAELDEAFNAAEGASKAAENKISYEEEGLDVVDDSGEGASGDPKKKLIIAGGITLVLVLLVGGILAFTSGGGKKEEKPADQKPVTENNAKPAEENNGQTPEVQETTVIEKPAVDNTALITAAEKLSKTVTAPAGWELRQGIINGRPLVGYFKPAPEGTGENALTENVSITAESLKAANIATEADYLAKSKSALATSLKDYKVTVEKTVKLSDGTGATLIGSSSTQNGNPIRSIQLFTFKDGAAYVVTGVVLASNWEAEKDMLGAAVLSFKFPE
jgi:hypothetical protein